MEVKMIDMKDIVTNPLQPRQVFDRDKLQELADSIREGELLQPIAVRIKGKKFEIVYGERRYKAFQILKEPKIPAIIRVIKDDTDALEKSTIENWQREDLTDTEKRKVINDLWNSGRYKTKFELSRKTGIHHNTINDYIEAEEYMSRVTTPKEASHTLVRETRDFTDKVRSKVIKTAVKEGITATEVREEIVPKLKTFDKPETQVEAFERIIERRKQNKKFEEMDFEQDVKRARGEAEPEHCFTEEADEVRLRVLKDHGDYFLKMTPSSINIYKNIKFKREALDYLEEVENSIHELRILLKDIKVV
jgi:ParB family chromosome partitioning protein